MQIFRKYVKHFIHIGKHSFIPLSTYVHKHPHYCMLPDVSGLMKSCFVKGSNGWLRSSSCLWWVHTSLQVPASVHNPINNRRSFRALIMVRQSYFCYWSRGFYRVILCFNRLVSLNSCYDNFRHCLFCLAPGWNTNGLAKCLISFEEFLCFSTQVIYPATVNYVRVPRGFVTVGSIFLFLTVFLQPKEPLERSPGPDSVWVSPNFDECLKIHLEISILPDPHNHGCIVSPEYTYPS